MGGAPARAADAGSADAAPSSMNELAKSLLTRVMRTIVAKCGALQHYIPRALTALATDVATRHRRAIIERDIHASIRAGADPILSADLSANEEAEPWKLSEEVLGSIKEIKAMIKTMAMGLKTVMWCISNLRTAAQAPGAPPPGTVMVCLYICCVNVCIVVCLCVRLQC